MKNFLIKILILIIAITILVFASFSYAADDDEFVPVTYLDTEASYNIPDTWIYEGVLYNKDYSQKKYTNINNLDVSILYGMRNLKEEIKKKMPFVPADTLLNSLSEESLVSILGSASNSTIEEKIYGENKFYEFLKTQKGDNGQIVNCIVDIMVEGDNIFSFSYVFKDNKDYINDYGKVLTSFKIAGKEKVEEKNIEIVEEKTEEKTEEIVKPIETVEVVETPVEEVKEDKNETEKEEIIEEPTTEVENTELNEDNEIETTISSGNIDLIVEQEDNNQEESINVIENDLEEEAEIDFEDMGIVQNTYESKSWIETIGSIILDNPILLIGIIVLAILEILFWRHIKKRKNNKSK